MVEPGPSRKDRGNQGTIFLKPFGLGKFPPNNLVLMILLEGAHLTEFVYSAQDQRTVVDTSYEFGLS